MKKITTLLFTSLLLFGLSPILSWGQTTVNYDFSDGGAESGLNASTPISLDSNIGFASFKNDGTSNPGIYSDQLRLYQNSTKGGSIIVYAQNGVTISEVVIYSSDRSGPAEYTVDGGSATPITISGGAYTISSINGTSEIEFYQKDGSSSNRIYVDSFEVTYTEVASGPTLTATSSITNLDYSLGSGPSLAKSFNLTGEDLDDSDVTLTAPSNFEISETEGSGYGNSITLSSYDGTSTTIYARLESGLTGGDYSGDITISGGGADSETVSLSGTVVAPESLPYTEDFSNCGTAKWSTYDEAGGESWSCSGGEYAMNGYPGGDNIDWLISDFMIDFDAQSSEVIEILTQEQYGNATNETGEIQLLYSTDYSGDPTSATWSSLTFDPNNTSSGGGLSTASTETVDASSITGTAYIAFKYDETQGSSGSEDWRIQNIEIKENAPELVTSDATLTGLNYMNGEGPSSESTFEVSGSLLNGTQDVTIALDNGASSDFEISLDNSTYGNSQTLSSYDGTATDVYVRLKAGLAEASYTGTVLINGYSLDEVEVALSGEVTPFVEQYEGVGEFVIISSEAELTDGYYVVANEDSEYLMTNNNSGSYFTEESITLDAENNIVNPDVDNVWYIESNGSGHTIYNDVIEKYVGWSSGNSASADDNVTDNARWTFTYESGKFSVNNVSTPSRQLSYNSGSPRFAAYGNSGQNELQFYKYTELTDPVLESSETEISSLDYSIENGPSTAQSFTVSGTNLDETDVTITAPSDFEVSETEGSGYDSSVTFSSFDGTETTIWLRLESGLEINDYSGDVTISGGGAGDVTIAISGQVSPDYDYIENFDNYPETSGSYSEGTFTGVAGNTWNYVDARGDNNIEGKNPGLQNNSDATLNASIQNGVSAFSFDYKQMFGSNVNLEVYINGELATTVTSSDEEGIVKNSGLIDVNYLGEFDIEFKQGSGGGQVGIDNFSWVSKSGGKVTIDGNAGWRMLSFPITGGTVEEISDNTAIQGVTGGDNAGEVSNFLTYDSDGAYETPADNTTAIGDGYGFITYFYDNTEAGSSELPLTLDASGSEPASDVNVTLNSSVQDAGAYFTMLGNPFASNYDMNNISENGGSIQFNIQLWDNDLGTYVAQDITTPFIASPWQGFWIESSDGATDVTFPTSGKTSSSATATYFSKEQAEEQIADVSFELSSEQSVDKALRLSFRQNAELGWDQSDASKLVPLTETFATLGFVGEDKLQSVYSLPYDLNENVELPIEDSFVGVSGDFTLSWNGMQDVPEGMVLQLHDYETGDVIDMGTQDSYTFEAIASAEKRVSPMSVLRGPVAELQKAKGTEGGRLGITITTNSSVSNEPGDTPESFALEQNYPNPFNPTTSIQYSVANAGEVELTIYNVMGQQVETLVSETKSAGTYRVSWNAANMASGIYYYRMQSGNQVITRQMTLIK